MSTLTHQSAQLYPAAARKPGSLHFQIQLPQLKTAIDNIDNARAAAIKRLRRVAVELIAKSERQLDELTDLLTATVPTGRGL